MKNSLVKIYDRVSRGTWLERPSVFAERVKDLSVERLSKAERRLVLTGFPVCAASGVLGVGLIISDKFLSMSIGAEGEGTGSILGGGSILASYGLFKRVKALSDVISQEFDRRFQERRDRYFVAQDDLDIS